MLISKLGEFGLIERLKRDVRTDSSIIKGIGDDCAVIKFSRDKYLLFTCDMLVEGVDFTGSTEPYLIGRKALAVSISDIASCGGKPAYALVSIGLPKKTPIRKMDRVMKGITDLAKIYKINIVGGDLSGAGQLVIDISMLGIVGKKRLVLREGAKTGDIIFVTGKLGGSIKGKHLSFTPRLKEAAFLVKNFHIDSMIDISDGLAQDLSHILKASNKGAVIYEGLIPLAKQALDLEDALYGGEDFELLFTVARKEARGVIAQKKFKFLPIGEIMPASYGLRLIDRANIEHRIEAKGYRHF